MNQECCGTCRYWEEMFGTPNDLDDPLTGNCSYVDGLPLSMAGFARREREAVRYDLIGCPCWAAPDESAGT